MSDGKKYPTPGSGACAGGTLTMEELKSANGQLATLNAELNHRLKNMMAVVIGLTNSTLGHAPGHPAHVALVGRLRAMARAYGTLAKVNWTQVFLLDMLQNETEHFDQSRLQFSGPEVLLDAQKALSVAVVFHELSTNAAQHGALATAEGTVSVAWEKDASGLRIQWHEAGGPAVREPGKMGLGLSLVQGEIGYRYGGSVQTRFDPAGVIVQITVPEAAQAPQFDLC